MIRYWSVDVKFVMLVIVFFLVFILLINLLFLRFKFVFILDESVIVYVR